MQYSEDTWSIEQLGETLYYHIDTTYFSHSETLRSHAGSRALSRTYLSRSKRATEWWFGSFSTCLRVFHLTYWSPNITLVSERAVFFIFLRFAPAVGDAIFVWAERKICTHKMHLRTISALHRQFRESAVFVNNSTWHGAVFCRVYKSSAHA
jgi:hypothetical protein